MTQDETRAMEMMGGIILNGRIGDGWRSEEP